MPSPGFAPDFTAEPDYITVETSRQQSTLSTQHSFNKAVAL